MDQSKPSSLTEIVEAHTFLENPLDEYANYTYNLEWFVVDRGADRKFQLEEAGNIHDIVNNNWPKMSDGKIIIAKTGVTTEFNLTDLNIESVGAGNATMSKIAGTAINLNFNITQVGDTNLVDTIQNAIALSGYHTINTTTFYIKINFVGFDVDGKNHKISQTKVIPFNINQYTQLQTQSDARGTTTVIQGVILPDRAVMDFSVSRTEDGFEYKVGEKLFDTLTNFITKLNEENKKAHPTLADSLQNTYDFTMSEQFETFLNVASIDRFGHEGMMGVGENMKKKSKGKGEAIGQVMAGMNIYSIIEEICQNNYLVMNELTTSWAKYSKVLKITPYLVPNENGFNPVTGKNAYAVEFYIDYEKKIVIQNMLDQADKATKSRALILELFKDQHVNKIYNYLFTGKNDQVLNFNITLDQELVKIYTVPGDFYAYEHFMKEGPEGERIGKAARAIINKSESDLKRLQELEKKFLTQAKELEKKISKEKDAFLPQLVNMYRQSLGITNPHADESFDDRFGGKTWEETLDQITVEGGIGAMSDLNKATIKENEDKWKKQTADAITKHTNATSNATAQQKQVAQEYSDAIASHFVVSNEFNYNTVAKQNAQAMVQKIAGKKEKNMILAEELDDDVISKLSNEDYEILLKNQSNNPIVFQRLINRLATSPKNTTLKHADPEKVRIAREKYYESKSNNISMIDASMTIKGDPYWLEGYMSPAMAKTEYGNIGTTRGVNASTTLNGSNGLILMSGIAAGTDLHDNVLKRNLITSLYVVTVVSSSFSQGIFTQTLKMRKNTEAEHMATVVAEIDLEEVETGDTNVATGTVGGKVYEPLPEIPKGLLPPSVQHKITNPHFVSPDGSLRSKFGTGFIGPHGNIIPQGELTKTSNTENSQLYYFQTQPGPGLIAFVKRKENFIATAFWDNKQWTNGYGTKAKSSTETISEHEATRRLNADLTARKTYVASYGQKHGYTWDNNQVDSMTSFAHNLGTGAVGQVTNNGTRTNGEIAEAMKLYYNANGVVLPGLKTRRNEEAAWFRRGIGVGV